MKKIISTLALIVAAATASAQSYSIDWFTIDGGGGTSTGGVYSVTGTIGQPDAGTLSGGSYTLAGGFWGIVSAVQSPGAPLLSIERIGGAVRVFWPKPSAGFVLDQSLTVTGAWSQVAFLSLHDEHHGHQHHRARTGGKQILSAAQTVA